MIAIWGANSFIGRHLVQALDTKGAALKLFARSFEGFPFTTRRPHARIVADFAQPDSYLPDLAGCDALILLVSASKVGTFADSPEREVTENLIPYRALLERLSATNQRPDHVIYLSSGGTVYGITDPLPVREDHPTHPISPYGQTKQAIENLITGFTQQTGCPTTILRIANPIGIWNKGGGLIEAAVRCAQTGSVMPLWGAGQQIRDYFDVRELAACITQITENIPKTSALYNVGSGRGHSINEVLTLIEQSLQTPIQRQNLPLRAFDVPYSVLDCTRVYKEIGWRAKRPLTEIIKEILESL